ncbi:hypothetical protein LCGC14_1360970 [marine sediment metagenome]|uniref:Uncharacterized protein n=1 Tax=marine sediment metagenome TaxID=412755 RepID=A0A0F9K8R8_9ZZZZ|nr:hypothetical protein [Pricia sp.]
MGVDIIEDEKMKDLEQVDFKIPDNSIYIGFCVEGKNYAKCVKLDNDLWDGEVKGLLAHALDQLKRMGK